MTILDPNRLNIYEADVEEWLYHNPGAIRIAGYPIRQWLGRQVRVPGGIIDLLGLSYIQGLDKYIIFVVEIKRGDIDTAALAQVSRYTLDVNSIIEALAWDTALPYHVYKVVIGSDISDQTFREAEALEVWVKTFSIELSLSLESTQWKDEYRTKRRDEWEKAAKNPEWATVASIADMYRGNKDDGLIAEFAEAIKAGIDNQE